MPAITTSVARNSHVTRRSASDVVRQAASENSRAVTLSTTGYRQETAALHARQRPRSTRKLRMGMLSNHSNSVPHVRHLDLGATRLSFRGNRTITTFRKLPMI